MEQHSEDGGMAMADFYTSYVDTFFKKKLPSDPRELERAKSWLRATVLNDIANDSFDETRILREFEMLLDLHSKEPKSIEELIQRMKGI